LINNYSKSNVNNTQNTEKKFNDASENQSEVKEKVQEEIIVVDFSDQIRSFLQAEDNRDFNTIYSFYAPEIVKYWGFKYPSEDKLKKEYTSSWNRTIYSQNNIERIEKVTDYSYIVYIDYEFQQYSREYPSHVSSELQFVFTEDGKISELYSVK